MPLPSYYGAIKLRPYSQVPVTGFTLTFGAAGVKEAIPAPYSNTKEIIVLNTSVADSLYIQIASVIDTDASGNSTIAIPASLDPAVSTLILPGTALTLAVGPEGYRAPMARSTFWRDNYGGKFNSFNLLFYAPTVTLDFDVNVTYVQSPGGGGGLAP